MGAGYRNRDGKLAVWVSEEHRAFLEHLVRHHAEHLAEIPVDLRGPDYDTEVAGVAELIAELTQAGT